MMNREAWESLIRNLLTLVGGYLIQKNIVDWPSLGVTWEGITGLVMALLGIWLGWKDKKARIEKFQSLARHVVSVFGGMWVAKGWITKETQDAILSLILSMIPIYQGYMSRQKVKQLAKGEITVHQLKGARKK